VASLARAPTILSLVRSRKPQVELYFDDGSMLAMPENQKKPPPS